MVTKQELSGSWNKIVGTVKEKYGQITDDELRRVEGNVDQLVGLVQRKSGQSREQIEAMLDECCHSANSAMNRVSEKASQYADNASEFVRDQYGQVSDQAQRGYQQSVRTISRHPLESAGVALGIGLIAGIAIGLSLSSRPQPPESFWQRRWS